MLEVLIVLAVAVRLVAGERMEDLVARQGLARDGEPLEKQDGERPGDPRNAPEPHGPGVAPAARGGRQAGALSFLGTVDQGDAPRELLAMRPARV